MLEDAGAIDSAPALVPQADGTFRFKRFVLTGVGLQIPVDADETEMREIGVLLGKLGTAAAWSVGDWLAYVEDRQWGETYRWFAEQYGYTVETLYTYVWLARRIEVSIRVETLGPSLHRLVATLAPEWQAHWLGAAAAGGWTRARLKEELEAWRVESVPAEPEGDAPPELISAAQRQAFGRGLKTLARARGGGEQAKEAARAFVRAQREWLEQVEALLNR